MDMSNPEGLFLELLLVCNGAKDSLPPGICLFTGEEIDSFEKR